MSASDVTSSASWMADLADQIRYLKLKEIVLPGTHDSGTYAITPDSSLAPDAGDFVKRIYHLPNGPELIARFMKAQYKSITEQLESGIRYLDLRVALMNQNFYIVHSLCSVAVEDILKQVYDFVAVYKNEIIILDFNHFYSIDTDHHTLLIEMIINTLGDLLIERSEGVNASLDTIWQKDKRVIVLYDYKSSVLSNEYLWFNEDAREESQIHSPWPDKQTINDLYITLKSELPNTLDTFFVLQGILSPPETISWHDIYYIKYIDRGLRGAAYDVNPNIIQWMNEWSDKGLNIIIIDWFDDTSTLLEVCIDINKKKKNL